MINTIKTHLPTIIAVIFTVIILAVTLLWFRGSIDTLTERSTQSYLSENVKAFATVFNTKLNDQMIMLESQARYFQDIDLTDYNAMKNTILATKGIGAFKTIGVANASGATINYNGQTSGNIMLHDYFEEAMRGKAAVSSQTTIDEEGDEVLVLAVPIMKDGAAAGVVFGTFGRRVLSSLVETVSFAQSGTNLLVAKDGTILARTEYSVLIDGGTDNFYDLIKGRSTTGSSDSVISFRYNGTDAIAALAPVGIHDWYFATLLPQSVISEQTAAISKYVIIVILIVALSFVLLFISILYLIRNNEAITKSNERFKLVTVESQDIIFDYDCIHKVLSLDGNIENIVKSDKKTFSRDELLELLDLIHSDDIGLKTDLISIPQSRKVTVRGEFRLKCTDSSFSWFRIKATVVRSGDGTPTQVVGSLVNVDEQMNKESMLIEKAERDSLTGIYNKGAFCDHVKEKLSKAGEDELFAMYIIDISDIRQEIRCFRISPKSCASFSATETAWEG